MILVDAEIMIPAGEDDLGVHRQDHLRCDAIQAETLPEFSLGQT
jgi:hypothetical protein